MLNDNPMTYREAESYCNKFNAHLTAVQSNNENSFVRVMVMASTLAADWTACSSPLSDWTACSSPLGDWIILFHTGQTSPHQLERSIQSSEEHWQREDTGMDWSQ